MISGARYSGVPHNVQVLPFTRLANPKSVTWKSVAYCVFAKCGHTHTENGSMMYWFGCVQAHLNVAMMVDEEILRFQISVYEI